MNGKTERFRPSLMSELEAVLPRPGKVEGDLRHVLEGPGPRSRSWLFQEWRAPPGARPWLPF